MWVVVGWKGGAVVRRWRGVESEVTAGGVESGRSWVGRVRLAP